MMKKLILILALFVSAKTQAQFTNDSLLNEVIQEQSGSDQVTPLIASRADGGAYISWFDQSTGAYVLKMNRLDAAGNKLWGATGVVVSNAPQNTALYRYDLKTDRLGNAVVAFQDQRTGNMQIVVQKLDSTGTPFWQTNGIVLQDADGSEGLSPVIGILGNNNVIVAWNEYSSTAKWVCYYELDPITGYPVTGSAPQKIKSLTAGTGYSRPYILPIGTTKYYIQYVQESGNFPGTTSKMYVQKLDAAYTQVWAAPVLLSSKTITFFFFPTVISDGTTGLLCAFNTSNPTNAALTSVYLQHMDSSGTTWSATGTPLTSSTTIQSYMGSYVHHDATNETWIALQVTNTSQSAAGCSLQRVDASGVLLSGTNGVVVDAQTADIIYPFGIAQNGNNAVILYTVGGFNNQKIKATAIDSMGVKQWAFGQKTICAALSNKDDMGSTPFINQSLIVVWTDTRVDNGIYAQNLNDDGTIGPLAVGINNINYTVDGVKMVNPSTFLSLQFTDSRIGSNEINIYSIDGRKVFSKSIYVSNSEIQLEETSNLPSGLYIVSLNNRQSFKWMKQ